MINKVIATSLFFLLTTTAIFGQGEHCGTDSRLHNLLQNDPNAAQRLKSHWDAVDEYVQSSTSRESQDVIVTIPVVFHVIHSGQPIGSGLNISDAQIMSQIEVLNECYRKRNADTALVPNWFKSRIADIGVEFCLASTDPNGNATTGINRYQYNNTSNFDGNIKPGTQWDYSKYLNIWTTNLGTSILGYATIPNMGPSNQDGVVLDYRYVGKAPANPFNTSYKLGKTAVHEVGHWLGLYHTFQDSCQGTSPSTCSNLGDRICDTPPTREANYGSPSLVQNTCTETPVDEYDMWMNYMDYVNDENLQMFTYGQRDVMRATLNTTRLGILSSLGCTNVFTAFNYTGRVVDANGNSPISGAKVLFDGALDFEATTDGNGYFTINGLYEGKYDVYAGKWGYMENFFTSNQSFDGNSSQIIIPLQGPRYYDDFIMNFGWTTSGNTNGGFWTRETPLATYYQGAIANPALDVQNDFGIKCFVTGNSSAVPTADDVDDGTATLISPPFDATAFTDPYIRFYRWFFDGSQSGNTPDDNMLIKINNGTQTVNLENITASSSQWTYAQYRLSDFISLTSSMRLLVDVSDLSSGNPNIVEGGLDRFEVLEGSMVNVQEIDHDLSATLFPNPSTGVLHVFGNWVDSRMVQIFVTNVSGQKVDYKITSSDHSFDIDLGTASNGLYFMAIRNAQGSEKILKFSLLR